ncbi:hypothetical protein T03_17251 [Trichinella britovi]|uniref:Transmembrane protein n=2 Tax=Trichinella TaxID=6333 RepID=A0A0V1CFB5_TRIBR|nr:hypothetical protein T05_1919 [Trichinella murrelli]KRY47943.1 hypothetical protein T03_17251 [Trichinella britovi]
MPAVLLKSIHIALGGYFIAWCNRLNLISKDDQLGILAVSSWLWAITSTDTLLLLISALYQFQKLEERCGSSRLGLLRL